MMEKAREGEGEGEGGGEREERRGIEGGNTDTYQSTDSTTCSSYQKANPPQLAQLYILIVHAFDRSKCYKRERQ